MFKRLPCGLLAILLVTACTFTPHQVKVTAKAPKSTSNIGAGVTIGLEVIDDRESTVVGQRGASLIGADITAGDVLTVLEGELTEAFRANGFEVVTPGSQADAEVEVRLRAFKFFVETGFFVGAENTSVVVAVEAKKGGRDLDRTYRASSEDPTLFVPGGASIDTKLNAALTRVLGQIVGDKSLLSFVAG